MRTTKGTKPLKESSVFIELKNALEKVIQEYRLAGKCMSISCQVLTAQEAIGNPEHNDYPIQKGKEYMVEAVFEGSKGQAFADEFENMNCNVEDLLNLPLDNNRKRASFISGLNAVFRHLKLCDKTIHCKDDEPSICAKMLPEAINGYPKVLLIGHQPRFLEVLARETTLRIIDRDKENIGRTISGILIESESSKEEAINWCDLVLATGSTLVNGTITNFIQCPKPVLFYGVTISAAAKILNLNTFCHCGH